MSNKKIADIVTNIETIYKDVYPNELKKIIINKFRKCSDGQLDACFNYIVDSFIPTGKVPLPLPPNYIIAIKSTFVCNYNENDIVTYKDRYLCDVTGGIKSIEKDISVVCSYGDSYHMRVGIKDMNLLIKYQLDNPGYPLISALRYERLLARNEDRTPTSILKMINNMPNKNAVEIVITNHNNKKK